MAKRERAVYVISVAADLAGVHPQTLRIYERKGLLRPERTAGNTRRYSAADIERLERIQALTQRHGVNLAGVRMILDLEAQLDRMRRDLDRMADKVQKAEAGVTGSAAGSAARSVAEEMRQMSREAGAILPVSSFRRLERLWRLQGARAATSAHEGPIPLGPVT